MNIVSAVLFVLEELFLLGILLAFTCSLLGLIKQKKYLLEAQEDLCDVCRRSIEGK